MIEKPPTIADRGASLPSPLGIHSAAVLREFAAQLLSLNRLKVNDLAFRARTPPLLKAAQKLHQNKSPYSKALV